MEKVTEASYRAKLSLLERMAIICATGGGVGYFPWAPGTIGTLVGVLLVLCTNSFSLGIQISIALAWIFIAVYAANRAGVFFGASDDSRIVSDEIAGYLVTMLGVPISVSTVILGFLLFRFFDIVKPWPASYFDQKMHNGLGNVLDDVVAALYSRAIIAAIFIIYK
jgi:phosphatidylglycerophosphatase A